MLHKSPTFFANCAKCLPPATLQVHSEAILPDNQPFSAHTLHAVKHLPRLIVAFVGRLFPIQWRREFIGRLC
jgi:hypothetical protein